MGNSEKLSEVSVKTGVGETESDVKTNKVLLRGSRGLFLSDGNKIYFPDRSFSDADEGFVKNIKVVKDKGTYAFITGEMVRDVAMSDDEIHGIVKEWGGVNDLGFYQGRVLGTDVVMKYIKTSDERVNNILVFIGGLPFCEITSSNVKYWLRERCTNVDVSRETVLSWMETGKESTTDEAMLALCKVYSENRYNDSVAAVFGRRIINLSNSNVFFRCDASKRYMDRVTAYSDKVRDSILDHLMGYSHGMFVEYQNVCDWAKENYVAIQDWGGDKRGTVVRRFRFMDSSADLILFGGQYLTKEAFEDEGLKEIVKNSAEKFDEWIRQCAKYCSGRNIGAISQVMRQLKDYRGY